MPRFRNLCMPQSADALSKCIEWKRDLIIHDKDKFSIPLHWIKGVMLSDPTHYKVYCYNRTSEMLTLDLPIPTDFEIPKLCANCDRELAKNFLNSLQSVYPGTYNETKPICCSPECENDADLIYLVYLNSNYRLDYTFEYKDNMQTNDFFNISRWI